MSYVPFASLTIVDGLFGDRLFPVLGAVGEQIFRRVRIRPRGRIGVGDQVCDGLRDAGEFPLPVEIAGARLIGRRQSRPETVGQLGQIAIGDEGVAQGLLLLFVEGQQGRLPDRRRSGFRR